MNRRRMGDPDWFRGDAPERVQRFEVSAIPGNRDATPPPPPTPARETSPGIGSDEAPETSRMRCQCLTPENGPANGLPDGYCGRCGRPSV